MSEFDQKPITKCYAERDIKTKQKEKSPLERQGDKSQRNIKARLTELRRSHYNMSIFENIWRYWEDIGLRSVKLEICLWN